MKTKAVQFTGYANSVADQMNKFLNDFEKSGNNIKILFQTQSSSANGQISVFLTYYEDDLPRHIPTREERTKVDWSGFPESTKNEIIEREKLLFKFRIRKSVLNMPQTSWEVLRNYYKEEEFTISVIDFWEIVGKHGGFLSAKLNEDEKKFSDLYYKYIRSLEEGA